MFPFWEIAVAPVIRAIGAKQVVEIGALRGDNTKQMLDELGGDTVLHVIDPVPDFDPAEHEARFGGQYVFHQDLSINVLPTLAPMDAAIIDGDHNWYTVYNECRLLAEVAEAAGQPMPLMVLHDVDWPYGRRDLYYDPSNIPDEHQQPYAKKGMALNKKQLVDGGLNRVLHNALQSDGPRNGVMTGLEDFMAEHPKPLRLVHLPLYFGLAIVVEQDVVDTNPALAAELDRLESAEGLRSLIELGERIRLKDKIWDENVAAQTQGRFAVARSRYLNLLKASLTGQHDLDNELRLEYLAEVATGKGEYDERILRDPRRWRVPRARMATAAHAAGDRDGSLYFPYTAAGGVRLGAIEKLLDEIRNDGVPGDLVDCGVGRGGVGIFFRGYLDAHELTAPRVWVADRFTGVRTDVTDDDRPGEPFPTLGSDLNNVRDGFAAYGLLDERVHFVQGTAAAALPDAPIERIAMLRVGAEAAREVGDILEALYDRVESGGVVIIENRDLAAEAVQTFRTARNIDQAIVALDDFTIAWRKTEPATNDKPEPRFAYRPPLVPVVRPTTYALSVVITFYKMQREAKRSLHALSRAYQQGIGDLEYEVIVVENGSPDGQQLDREFVESFGPEFRFVDLGANATSSPTTAMNEGMAQAKGDVVILMVDGAHVITPGVFSNVLAAQRTYGPSVVGIQQWYVGPGQQPATGAQGYDQAAEDRLFDAVKWPTDGYRLFEIGHFIGTRDWFDGMGESNCVAAPRTALEQIGGFDDSFDEAGGGFMNLDMFERLVASPDLTVVTVLGEGSFHQVHGGTTTNLTDADQRANDLARYIARYEEVRAKMYRGSGREPRYLGTLPQAARLTRARRQTAMAFRTAQNKLEDGLPAVPMPVPDRTLDEYIDAYWNSLSWQNTQWLGQAVPLAPGDLIAYQTLLGEVRPDWIIDLSQTDGGRAFYFASVCDLLGHGQVLSIVDAEGDDQPEHDRLTKLVGNAVQEPFLERVAEITNNTTNGFVVLGTRKRPVRMLTEFAAYRDFVGVGSYLCVEMTIVNGNPIWPEHGPGPAEAAASITHEHREFAPDPRAERFGFSFNPGGFFKRMV